MPSYTIPEEVLGIPLFVPSDYDAFEIVSGGMPNGDDCLRVRGDLLSNFKAFCPAPITTPPIGANGTVWTLTLWIKAPSGGGASTDPATGAGAPYQSCILSMMRAVNASAGSNSNGLWALSAHTTAGSLQFTRSQTTGATSVHFTVIGANVRDNTWHMITIMTPTSTVTTTGYMYKDQDLTEIASDTQNVAAGSTLANMFLCIGKYSNLAGSGFNQDFQIGKIAFHDHHLTITERAMLYKSMVG